MPVRSLSSSVFVWPTPRQVDAALRGWAAEQVSHRPGLLALGYFGSYARGDSGVGSDLDVVAVVSRSELPPERRSLDWDTSTLPVPVDLFVFTRAEWDAILARATRFSRMLRSETRWVWQGPGTSL